MKLSTYKENKLSGSGRFVVKPVVKKTKKKGK